MNPGTGEDTQGRDAPLPFQKLSKTRWLVRDNDPYDLEKELSMHYKFLYGRLYNKDRTQKILENVEFGVKFNQEIRTYMTQLISSPKQEEKNKIKCVKLRCQALLQEALKQVEKRLPDSVDIFKGLSFFNPHKLLSQIQKGHFEDLPCLHLTENNFDLIESQYKKINLVQWSEEEPFVKNGIPKDSLNFWLGVAKHSSFKELSTFALTCLITPASNAIVERIFSLVAAIKTKPRNRTQTRLLESFVRIQTYLLGNKICCKEFRCTNKMLYLHNSEILYSSTGKTANIEEEREDEKSFLEELL
ncbi:hypothetical protein SK128_003864 [Halocaridina rubra]|uniref:HAT C-terminal dimerisation domain-containing protein n=1 Tax=Halocaridina rubra TaxID=373956 RepID=A0AAN9AEA7_HALRR